MPKRPGPPCPLARWPRAAFAAALCLASRVAAVQSGTPDEERYIIASFPKLQRVDYARLPDPTWRPLVIEGLTSPGAVVVDPQNSRLFVADIPAQQVYWFQLHSIRDGKLITDGQRHIAMNAVAARGLAVDGVGNLYASGRSLPEPPLEPVEGVFKQDAAAIATSAARGIAAQSTPIWTRAGAGPQLVEAAGLAVDPFNVFWGNMAREEGTGTVVKAPVVVPQASPASSIKALADNVDNVLSMVLTPTNIFYGSFGGVYGVPQGKAGPSCGGTGQLCPRVVAIGNPTGLCWDGDGTIYVADRGSGAVYSFASGTVTPHLLEKVGSASGVWGLTFLDGAPSGAPGARPSLAAVLVASAAVALAVPWGGRRG